MFKIISKRFFLALLLFVFLIFVAGLIFEFVVFPLPGVILNDFKYIFPSMERLVGWGKLILTVSPIAALLSAILMRGGR